RKEERRSLRRSQIVRRIAITLVMLLAVGAASASGAAAYRVRAGDTLTGIALAHDTTVTQLERLNGLEPGGVLFAGATLRLPTYQPTRRRYQVQPGDTLTLLAERF